MNEVLERAGFRCKRTHQQSKRYLPKIVMMHELMLYDSERRGGCVAETSLFTRLSNACIDAFLQHDRLRLVWSRYQPVI